MKDGGLRNGLRVTCFMLALGLAFGFSQRATALGDVSTFAGTGVQGFSGDGGAATSAQLNAPRGIAADTNGNLYFSDTSNHRIRKVATDGTISTFAGTGVQGFSGDGGAATSAQLSTPRGIAFNNAGDLFIADSVNHRIRKVATDGTITTIAGTGVGGFSGDGGPGTSAQLFAPTDVAFDGTGFLYIADSKNHRIRRIDFSGIIATRAGTGVAGNTGDFGPPSAAQFNTPEGLAVDAIGDIFIADTGNHRIRKLRKSQLYRVLAVAGSGTQGFSGDGGTATNAKLNTPKGVAFDNAGDLFIADSTNHRIRKVSGNVITTAAGTGVAGFSGDGGAATSAQLNSPRYVAFDSADNLYIADSVNHRIRKILDSTPPAVLFPIIPSTPGPTNATSIDFTVVFTEDVVNFDATNDIVITHTGTVNTGVTIANGPATYTVTVTGVSGSGSFTLAVNTGSDVQDLGGLALASSVTSAPVLIYETLSSLAIITTAAGNGVAGFSGDGGTATSAQLNLPYGIMFDNLGNLFIADRLNHRIRKVDTSNIMTTFAGNGVFGFSGDGGAATSAQLFWPQDVVYSAGSVFIADSFNNRVRKVDIVGTIFTYAGTGTAGFSGEGGPLNSANLNDPRGITVDADGNIYLADTSNNRIRELTFTNPKRIFTRVGFSGTAGFSGDGGSAFTAKVDTPRGIAFDDAGNYYFADTANQRIRKVSSGGITSVAGNGVAGFGGDGGQATSAQLNNPNDVTVDGAGNLYIADTNNHRVRKVDTSGVITTIAGIGSGAFSGDGGLATSAELSSPIAVALDGAGNLFISDRNNHRIRKVLSDSTPPVVTVDSLTTNDSSPALSGTIDDATASISVTVDGQTNPATNNGTTWDLANGTLSTLAIGTYDVAVTATDAIGNAGTDATTAELTIASSGPGNGGDITINLPTNAVFPGNRLELTAPGGGTNYVWKKDGVAIPEDAPRVTGTTSQILVIDPVAAGDAGNYTVTYEDGLKKNIVETTSFSIVVQAIPGVPAAQWGAIGLLILALLLASIIIHKRRRNPISRQLQ